MHKAIEETKVALLTGKRDWRGTMELDRRLPHLWVNVSDVFLPRAFNIMGQAIAIIEEMGGTLQLGYANGYYIQYGGLDFSFSISNVVQRIQKGTPELKPVCRPRPELILRLSGDHHTSRHIWNDKDGPIEHSLHTFPSTLKELVRNEHEHKNRKRPRSERVTLVEIDKPKARPVYQILRSEEMAFVQAFDDWTRAQSMRGFIKRAEKSFIAKPHRDSVAWLKMAHRYVDRLDPLVNGTQPWKSLDPTRRQALKSIPEKIAVPRPREVEAITNKDDRFCINAKEAARLLGVPVTSVYQLPIEKARLGKRRLRFTLQGIEKYLQGSLIKT